MTCDTINDAVTMAGGSGTLLANRYRIVRQLGSGGMGSVWLAEDTQLDDKPFAIKMLPSILVSNKRAYSQLKAEALVAMKLVHPNIVQIRAFEENDGNPFLVMDYIDGQTLDDYLAEHGGGNLTQSRREAESQRDLKHGFGNGIPEEDVVRILKPIAAALDYAHSQGVVHRDVKPANVMIRKDGTPFILDFGIAREIQETMTRVTGKLSSGTLLYMSPEQLMGEKPTPAQDIYSFAAMAYECLKGEPPFTRGQIEFQIMNKVPDHLVGASVPLARSVMAGLAKKPEDRLETCAAVLGGDEVISRGALVEAERKRREVEEQTRRGTEFKENVRHETEIRKENVKKARFALSQIPMRVKLKLVGETFLKVIVSLIGPMLVGVVALVVLEACDARYGWGIGILLHVSWWVGFVKLIRTFFGRRCGILFSTLSAVGPLIFALGITSVVDVTSQVEDLFFKGIIFLVALPFLTTWMLYRKLIYKEVAPVRTVNGSGKSAGEGG